MQSEVINAELPKRSRELLAKCAKREITQAELDLECAYWVMTDLFDEFDYRPMPAPEIPSFVSINFLSVSAETQYKLRMDSENKYWRHPDVQNYGQKLQDQKNHNRRAVQRLWELQDLIPKEDEKKQNMIIRRLGEFSRYLRDIDLLQNNA